MSFQRPGSGALQVRRSRTVETDVLRAVVIEIDPTQDTSALVVLQAQLHEPPAGQQLVFGYDVMAAGLGAWVGDRQVRISIWPALVDDEGTISAADPDESQRDLLVIDIDPLAHRAALEDLTRLGRLVIAAPDAGPVPLVVDIDTDLLESVLGAVTGSGTSD